MKTRESRMVCLAACAALVSAVRADDGTPGDVTVATLADPAALAELEKPGKILFQDDFETPASLDRYFEIRGRKEGHAALATDPGLAHGGSGCIRFTAPGREGKESGVGASYWFGPDGYDTISLRRHIRFAADYDQGNLHHVGGGLAAIASKGKWDGMGKAGLKPEGNDRFTCRFEPWCDWKRVAPPGYMFLYTYWMDMKRDKDGNFWGNNLEPAVERRIVLRRDHWHCLEHMISANTPGKADGELAAWIDGKLYLHFKGIRWRSDAAVKLKRFEIGLYVHQAARDNTVWYDDVAISTGHIGPSQDDSDLSRRESHR